MALRDLAGGRRRRRIGLQQLPDLLGTDGIAPGWSVTPARNSSRPARIVVRDRPVARSTIAMPPSGGADDGGSPGPVSTAINRSTRSGCMPAYM